MVGAAYPGAEVTVAVGWARVLVARGRAGGAAPAGALDAVEAEARMAVPPDPVHDAEVQAAVPDHAV